MLSTLYVLVLIGVALMVLAGLIEAVIAVSRKPDWQSKALTPRLSLVSTDDRRSAQLPYVGVDRREAEHGAAPAVHEAPRQAA